MEFALLGALLLETEASTCSFSCILKLCRIGNEWDMSSIQQTCPLDCIVSVNSVVSLHEQQADRGRISKICKNTLWSNILPVFTFEKMKQQLPM